MTFSKIFHILNTDSKNAFSCVWCGKYSERMLACSASIGKLFCNEECADTHWERVEGNGTKRKQPDEPNTVVNPPGADATQNEQMLRVLFSIMKSSPTFWKDFIEETTLERIRTWTTTSRLFNEYFSQRPEFWYYLLAKRFPFAFYRKRVHLGALEDKSWIDVGKNAIFQDTLKLFVSFRSVQRFGSGYKFLELEKQVGETPYDSYLRVFNDHFGIPPPFTFWTLTYGESSYLLQDSEEQPKTNKDGNFPFNSEYFDSIPKGDFDGSISVRMWQKIRTPTIFVKFMLLEQMVLEARLEAEDMLDSFRGTTSIQEYAARLPLPNLDELEQNKYDIIITERWTNDCHKIKFTLGERIIWEAFLEFMKKLHIYFNEYAGPWIGDDITWQNRIEIIPKK